MKTFREELIEVRNKIDELIKLLEPETEVKTFPKPKGRPKTAIFHDRVDEELLANCISSLHQQKVLHLYHLIRAYKLLTWWD